MTASSGDPALETLFVPFSDETLSWPGQGALFLGARDGWPLHAAPRPGLVCEQDWKPDVDALRNSGLEVRAPDEATYPLVLVLPPRQRDAARALFARALSRCGPGGMVVAAMPNDAGAKSGEADLERLAGALASRSKHKCRVFWTRAGSVHDTALVAAWQAADAPREVLEGRFTSRPGVFAWDRIDQATSLLGEYLPGTLCGRAADLGGGHGVLSDALLRRCAGITALDVYEADARALELARINLACHADRVAIDYRWHDVTAGIAERYDVIVTNPPFHAQGSRERPDIGRAFIAAAAGALNPGGRLWLVANRHLPYEQVLDASFGEVRMIAQRDGFKVVEAVRAVATRAPVRTRRRA